MEVLNIADQEDGSVIVSFDMTNAEMIALAKIGLLKVLADAVATTDDK